MDLILFFLTLGAAGFACAMAVLSAWFARKNNVSALRSDVAEMLDTVDKIARDTRSARMQRVRAAREDAPTPTDAPPQLRQTQTPLPLTKAELRAKFGMLNH